MEFDELKKIWDTQNNETMYAINESTLHKSIIGKKERSERMVTHTEIILIALNIGVGSYILYDTIVKNDTIFDYLMGFFMLLSASYLLISHIKRKRNKNSFDRTMLDDLDGAISYADYLIVLSSKVIWWYSLPILALIALKYIAIEADIVKWLIILPFFIVAYFLGKWEVKRCHLPRKRKLEALRAKLVTRDE